MAPTFGDIVQARMDALHLSRTDVLERLQELHCGVTPQALSLWIRGERSPRAYRLVALLDVLQVHGMARAEALNALGRPSDVVGVSS